MKRIARQRLHTFIEVIRKRLAHIYICMTLYNTSVGQATQSHEAVMAIDLKSYDIQQAFDYDYSSNVWFARGLIFLRALKKSNAKIDKVGSIREARRRKLNLPHFAFSSRSKDLA